MAQKLTSVHLRATWQQNHGAKTDKYTDTQKTPSEKNCSELFFCVSVYLFSGQRNHSLNPVFQLWRVGNLTPLSFGRGPRARQKTIVSDQKMIISGGISYVAFGIKFTSRQIVFFPRQMGFLVFCSRNFFPQKNSLGV